MTEAVSLKEAAFVNPKAPKVGEIDPEQLYDFVPMQAVHEDGRIDVSEARPHQEVAKGYTSFRSGDVLVAKITPCFENGKIALAETRTEFAFGSTEFHVIRSRENISDPRYLLHFLRLRRIRLEGEKRMTGSAGQKRVPRIFLEDLKIPLPEIGEQLRIVEILDKADGIRRKRVRLLNALRDYLRSAYVHTVGHLNPHHGDWEPFTIEALAEDRKGAIRSGPFGSALRHGEFVDEGIAVLGIDNAVQNKFAWSERRFITPYKYEELRRYTVFPGDVIVTIMGTTGRSAVVPDDIPEAITTKHLATITCNKELIHPEVLSFAIHSDPLVIRQIKSFNKGAIMDGLNLGIIRKLEINLPPMAEQLRFVSMLQKAKAIEAKSQTPNVSGEDLFQSLSQRAFRGEL